MCVRGHLVHGPTVLQLKDYHEDEFAAIAVHHAGLVAKDRGLAARPGLEAVRALVRYHMVLLRRYGTAHVIAEMGTGTWAGLC